VFLIGGPALCCASALRHTTPRSGAPTSGAPPPRCTAAGGQAGAAGLQLWAHAPQHKRQAGGRRAQLVNHWRASVPGDLFAIQVRAAHSHREWRPASPPHTHKHTPCGGTSPPPPSPPGFGWGGLALQAAGGLGRRMLPGQTGRSPEARPSLPMHPRLGRSVSSWTHPARARPRKQQLATVHAHVFTAGKVGAYGTLRGQVGMVEGGAPRSTRPPRAALTHPRTSNYLSLK
jgi:hypothetical protein